ncbi:MAG: hypothetical protein DHS20C07_17020 [Methyloligella sp.]|nr:MAG: hypothetical protein DHS20C07_17020 [Methyloligella sp.]
MKYDINEIKCLQRLIIYTQEEAENCGDTEVTKLLSLVSEKVDELILQISIKSEPNEEKIVVNNFMQIKKE